MPRISLQLETPIERTFRVEQVAGIFDVAVADKATLRRRVHVPLVNDSWTLGAIIGPSGSGKSQVGRQAYGKAFVEPGGITWPRDKAIVDGFPAGLEFKQIARALGAVGFEEPPAWVLPYDCLSTGQRMRCDLARVLLREEPVIAFDEFTSVVDRQVGQFASASLAKAMRKHSLPLERFVAVTCHDDVIDWLCPDWILDMASGVLVRGSVQPRDAEDGAAARDDRKEKGTEVENEEAARLRERCHPHATRPPITIEVRQAEGRGAGVGLWQRFKRHHYLSGKLHPSARAYAAIWRGEPIGFCATIPNAGHKGRRIVHRLVVLPDFQGMGIGLALLDAVCAVETGQGFRLSIRTSHPALVAALRRRPGWRQTSVDRVGKRQSGFSRSEGRVVGSMGRGTVGFDFRRRP